MQKNDSLLVHGPDVLQIVLPFTPSMPYSSRWNNEFTTHIHMAVVMQRLFPPPDGTPIDEAPAANAVPLFCGGHASPSSPCHLSYLSLLGMVVVRQLRSSISQ